MLTDKMHMNTAAGGISIATFAGECIAVVTDLRWLIILAGLLIAGDFWWAWRECITEEEQTQIVELLSSVTDQRMSNCPLRQGCD